MRFLTIPIKSDSVLKVQKKSKNKELIMMVTVHLNTMLEVHLKLGIRIEKVNNNLII